MPVLSVDGMDPEDIYLAAATAVATARSGGGPSFLECRTYRYVGQHTAEASMKLNYRSAEEMERWCHLDPLVNWPIRLEAEGLLSSDGRREIDEEVENTLDEAVEFARRSPEPTPEEALDFAYAGVTNARFPARGWRES